jgi:hypothetical protein
MRPNTQTYASIISGSNPRPVDMCSIRNLIHETAIDSPIRRSLWWVSYVVKAVTVSVQ